MSRPPWACDDWQHEHAWWACPQCVEIAGLQSRRHSTEPVDASSIDRFEGYRPPWSCDRWGDYEHDWLDCPECLEQYEQWQSEMEMISNPKSKPGIVVVDDFLQDPMAAREAALEQNYVKLHSQGLRSDKRFADPDLIPIFEELLGKRIVKWDYDLSGRFQYCVSTDQIVYHSDNQTNAASLFLTPGAPIDAGVSFYRSRDTGLRYPPADPGVFARMYENNLFDSSKWEEIDRVGNVFNRLVIWNGFHVHAATKYFGHNLQTGRLFQVFFFDTN